ncbi:uncharacterized protein LOC113334661 [Papaver somniferum]|uniref:uncharacterized protein LOC113334661 n=1 Tax=Papaver somniferum TaxID=3469 RepID=UPI000E701C57|nr:uncharacterized protein LOC113334661 [Papaver somniferum]
MGKLNNSLLVISIVIVLLSVSQTRNVHGGVYRVTHRFGDEAVEDPENRNHNHHGRLLAANDFPFDSEKGVVSNRLYCEEIPIGSYLDLHMDATDALWVKHCCKSDHPCTSKYLITFILHCISFNDQISENRTTIAATSTGIFLYDHRQTAVSTPPYDPPVLSSVVVSGKVTKKKFFHCLDGRNGIGIVVVGDVVQPNLKTTPLFSNHSRYYVNMREIEVGNVVLIFSNEVFPVQDGKRTMMDSGTAMSYFPEGIFNELYKMVMSSQLSSGLETRIVEENNYTCFSFNKSVDDYFPYNYFYFREFNCIVVLPT